MVATPACPAGRLLSSLYHCGSRLRGMLLRPFRAFFTIVFNPGASPRATHMTPHSGLWKMIVVFYINISPARPVRRAFSFYNPEQMALRSKPGTPSCPVGRGDIKKATIS